MARELFVRWPLEFLEGHHDRQLLICAALEHIAVEPGAADTPETAGMVLDYIAVEMPLHIADEEEDLFPRLRARCQPDDGLDDAVAMLEAEHASDTVLHERLVPVLTMLADGNISDEHSVFARDAVSFAALQRRHLTWENGLILPLARKRLSADDLDRMAESMTRRRSGL